MTLLTLMVTVWIHALHLSQASHYIPLYALHAITPSSFYLVFDLVDPFWSGMQKRLLTLQ